MAPMIDGGPEPEPLSTAPSEDLDTIGDEHGSTAPDRLDRWLTIGVWGVSAAIVLLAAWFGWSYYLHTEETRLASPALRVVDSVRKQVAAKPGDPVLHSRLAEALGAIGDLDAARQELAVAIKLDPKYVGAYQNLAQIEMLQKDYTRAEQHYLKVLELSSSSDYQNVNQRREQAFFYLGEIALLQKRYEDAVGYYKESIRIRKDASDSYLRLAQAYEGLDMQDLAFKQLEIALKFDPRFAEAHYERGKLYLKQGDKVQAAWDFRAALDFMPNEPEPKKALDSLGDFQDWYDKAAASFKAGDISDAADAVRIARAIEPGSYEAAMLHGKILERQGKPSEAADAYEIAVKVKPGDKLAMASVKRSKEASETKAAK